VIAAYYCFANTVGALVGNLTRIIFCSFMTLGTVLFNLWDCKSMLGVCSGVQNLGICGEQRRKCPKVFVYQLVVATQAF
jgi:uncharacterized membrane protein